jgi:hypothetical protein
MMHKELENIKKLGLELNHFIATNQIGKAKKIISKLERSFFVSEAEEILIPAKSRLLILQGELEEAKRNLLTGICYCWNSDEAFELLRLFNPYSDKKTKYYYLEVIGGDASFGVFTRFSKDHIGTFEIAANDISEAISYIDEVCSFAKPEDRKIYFQTECEPPINLNKRGIYYTFPFRLEGSERSWAA